MSMTTVSHSLLNDLIPSYSRYQITVSLAVLAWLAHETETHLIPTLDRIFLPTAAEQPFARVNAVKMPHLTRRSGYDTI